MKKHIVKPTLVVLLSFSLLNISCAHTRTKNFESALAGGRCEDALENIPEKDGQIKFLGEVNRTTGQVLSYAATGAGYTADVLLTVAGGAVLFTVLCAPLLAVGASGWPTSLDGSVNTGPQTPYGPCLPVNLSHLSLPHLGKDIYEGTEAMRCPDLTALSKSVRRVATCSEARETPAALTLAKKTLSSVVNNKDFMSCITADERSSLQTDAYRIEAKLNRSAASGI